LLFFQAKYIGMGVLPIIIGGADLVRFSEEMSTLTQEWQYEREVTGPVYVLLELFVF